MSNLLTRADYLAVLGEPTATAAALKLYPDARTTLHRRKQHGQRILINRLRRDFAGLKIDWPAHWKRGRPPARYNRAEATGKANYA